MFSAEIERRIQQLEERLSRIEQLLQPASAESPAGPDAARDEVAVPVESLERLEPIQPVVDERGYVFPTITDLPPPLPVEAISAAAFAEYESDPDFVPPVPPVHSSAARQANGLEAKIGLQVAGWVGAVVLTIGAALGIKFAYDEGYFRLLSPVGRLCMMTLAGFALLGTGEWVYRRINRIAAASLYGAGVAVFFLVAYAGHAYYGLYGRETSFVLMALSTLIGAAVAMRGALVSIAVLAMIGGHLAPIILHHYDFSDPIFLIYLGALQALALFLTWRGRDIEWLTLRSLALVATLLWMCSAVDTLGVSLNTQALFVAKVIYAAMFHLEVILSNKRSPRQAHGRALVLVVTALLLLGLLAQIDSDRRVERSIVVIALIIATAALSLVVTRYRELARSYRLQAVALGVVLVPVALSGIWIVVAWGVMGVAFSAGAAMNLFRSRLAGPVVWWLAVLQLIAWTTGLQTVPAGGILPRVILFDIGGLHVRVWWVVCYLMTICGHLIAMLMVRRRITPTVEALPVEQETSTGLEYASPNPGVIVGLNNDPLAPAATVVAIAATMVSLATLPVLPAPAATLFVLLMALAVYLFRELNPSCHLAKQAGVLLFLAAGKWIFIDTRQDAAGWALGLATRWTRSPTVAGAALAVLTGTAAIVTLRGSQQKVIQRQTAGTFGLLALVVLVWLGSYEIKCASGSRSPWPLDFEGATRGTLLAISVFWASFALATMITGFIAQRTLLRYFGLSLMAVALAKVVFVDLVDLATGYRVLSFIILGLLLLATSVLYGRFSERILATVQGRR